MAGIPFFIFGSGETDMTQSSSLQNYENRIIYEGPPPQGLSEALRAGSFFEFLVSDPPQGRPIGGGGIHRTSWIE